MAADKEKWHGSLALLPDLQVSQLPTEATGAPHRVLTLQQADTRTAQPGQLL